MLNVLGHLLLCVTSLYVYHWNFEDILECRLEVNIKMDLRDIWGGCKLKSLAMVYITMEIRVL